MKAAFSSPAEKKQPAPMRELDRFQYWIDFMSSVEKRLYYRDQTAEAMLSLFTLARSFKPTVIVELGTSTGMSLRTWLLAAPDAKVTAVDLSFDELVYSAKLLAFDLARPHQLQTNILALDFKTLWAVQDRVLVFVDAHDLPNVPIMQHVLENALPHLPDGSLVIVDDLWHSQKKITPENVEELFRRSILPQIDELLSFDAHHAPYHKGGDFWGFAEVVPLLRYINKNRIDLQFDPQGKHVAFYSRKQASAAAGFDENNFTAQCGKFYWHPLAHSLDHTKNNSESHIVRSVVPKIMDLYEKGAFEAVIDFCMELTKKHPEIEGLYYTLGLTLARYGEMDMAAEMLRNELSRANPHPNAAHLTRDIQTKFQRHKLRLPAGKILRPGLTLFSTPKAFSEHENIIQRNALQSWLRITPKPDILLVGDDPGTAEICAEFGLTHIPAVKRNDLGTPLLDDIFLQAQNMAETEFICYVNTDIILFNDIMDAIKKVSHLEQFLLVGDRIDYDQNEALDFSDPAWAAKLRSAALKNGVRHLPHGMDYFLFRPGLYTDIPPFALGRYAWDGWLFHNSAVNGHSVIDCSEFVTIVHQNHIYRHIPGGTERNRNIVLSSECQHDCCRVDAAPYYLDRNGELIKR